MLLESFLPAVFFSLGVVFFLIFKCLPKLTPKLSKTYISLCFFKALFLVIAIFMLLCSIELFYEKYSASNPLSGAISDTTLSFREGGERESIESPINAEVILAIIALVITILMTGILFLAKNTIDDLKKEKDAFLINSKNAIDELKEEKNKIANDNKEFKIDVKEKFKELDIKDLMVDIVNYRHLLARQNDKEIQSLKKNSILTKKQESQYDFRLGLGEMYDLFDEKDIKNYLEYLGNYKKTNNVYLSGKEYEYLDTLDKYYREYYTKNDQKEIIGLLKKVDLRWRRIS